MPHIYLGVMYKWRENPGNPRKYVLGIAHFVVPICRQVQYGNGQLSKRDCMTKVKLESFDKA